MIESIIPIKLKRDHIKEIYNLSIKTYNRLEIIFNNNYILSVIKYTNYSTKKAPYKIAVCAKGAENYLTAKIFAEAKGQNIINNLTKDEVVDKMILLTLLKERKK